MPKEMPDYSDEQYAAFSNNFFKQKAVKKRDLEKCPAGTWLEVKFLDMPNTVALLLFKNGRGDKDLTLHFPEADKGYWMATTDQVVRIIGPVVVPADLEIEIPTVPEPKKTSIADMLWAAPSKGSDSDKAVKKAGKKAKKSKAVS